MLTYILKRILYALPILIGVNLITFLLFFMVNTPDDMARSQLGAKRVTAPMIEAWKVEKGYDKPLFVNEKAEGLGKITDTLFVQESIKLFSFDFGFSDANRNIGADIKERMIPSLSIALPTFAIALITNISLALLLVLFRGSTLDTSMMVVAVMIMSVSGLFYIIAGQVLLSKMWHWVPISGYASGFEGIKFVILPVLIGVFAGIGSGGALVQKYFLRTDKPRLCTNG